MEIKVKALDDVESKSVQEVEKDLLDKHEEQFEDAKDKEEVTVVEETPQADSTEEATEESSLTDEDVLSYIGKRYGKEINSFDELMAEREASEDLPEDVSAYFKYKKETVKRFKTLKGAMYWCIKTGRTIIYEIEADKPYKLPDHHNKFGQAYWNDRDIPITKIKCIVSAI